MNKEINTASSLNVSVSQQCNKQQRGAVATRIILLFFASLRENLFVFLFPLLLLFKFISVT